MSKRNSSSQELQEGILKLLEESSSAALSKSRIISGLALHSRDRDILKAELQKLEDKGRVVRTTRGHYGLPGRLDFLMGTLELNRRGSAYLRPDERGEPVYIAPHQLGEAGHGDRVMVRLETKKRKRKKEGVVVRVLKRGKNRFLGTLKMESKKRFVVPDDRRFPGVISVSSRSLKGAQSGDRVVVEMQGPKRDASEPSGVVVDRFGPAGSPGAEERAFNFSHDLPGEFPPKLLKEVEGLPREQEMANMASRQGRLDLRSAALLTIDGDDARDFDDAVSLEITEENVFRLGVHIADVAEFVRPGGPVDQEARERATSIYLADRVIHMLPPALSEGLCSLQAGKDRLALSVFMDIDLQGQLVGVRFAPSLIRVGERLTYGAVEEFLREGRDHFALPTTAPLLEEMSYLAARLRRRRFARGALDLDLPETVVKLDEKGQPLAVEKKKPGRAESLIEEFMIFCNEAVAEYLAGEAAPCLYRVHARPTAEKLAFLRETLTLMGVSELGRTTILKPRHLKSLLEKTRHRDDERLVCYLVLRSLPQARYSDSHEGHFGLASPCYCHFTSPIRRYPDLVVHRILKERLGGKKALKAGEKKLRAMLPQLALHCSEKERLAAAAERDALDIKKAQFMSGRIGEVFPGIINGVTNFGLFVELDNTVEGMIPLNDLKDDYYVYHEKSAAVVGERTRRQYRLGGAVKVRVAQVRPEEGKITFALEEETSGRQGRRRREG